MINFVLFMVAWMTIWFALFGGAYIIFVWRKE